MNPSAALHVVKQENLSALEVVAMVINARCIQRLVLSVIKTLKFPSNLAKADQFIVEIATAKSN
jgi:hypothetical protein